MAINDPTAQPLDISALTAPTSGTAGPMPAPNQSAPPAAAMTPGMAAPDVTDRSINPTQPPAGPAGPVPVTGGHSKLAAMVQGLAIGLSAAGTSLGTHGREGGAPEVQQYYANQQAQKQSAAAAQTAQKNAALQQQLLTGEINRQNGQNYILMGTTPDEMNKSHVASQAASMGLQSQAQDMFDTKGQVPAGWSVDPNTGQVFQGQQQTPANGSAPAAASTPGNASTPNLLPGVTPGAPATGTAATGTATPTSGIFVARQNMILDAAGKELQDAKGNDDPLVAAARKIVADPNSTPQQKRQATLAVQNKAGLSADVVKNLTAKADLELKQATAATAGLPKTQSEAAAQLAAAQKSGDRDQIAKAQAVKDAVDKTVQDERQFSSNLQAQNQAANKQLALQNTVVQKAIEDSNKLWTDPQHGFAQTAAQVNATKNIVAQSKNGSELAASLEPAMVVLGVNSFAGVHRISPTEYEAAGPAVGSLYRRLNALLDKAGKGAVPAATLSEVNGIMDSLLRGKYQSALDSTRQEIQNAPGLSPKTYFVPDPNNYGALTSLDKIPVASLATTPTGPDPFAQFGGKRHQQ